MSQVFIPLFDRVVVKREISALERRTAKSGLHLPDNTKESHKSCEGTIISCADNVDDRVKALIGKKVLFNKYSGEDIKVGEDEFCLITDTDIFGELKDE